MLIRNRFSVSGELYLVVITALWENLEKRRPTPHRDFTVEGRRPADIFVSRCIGP